MGLGNPFWIIRPFLSSFERGGGVVRKEKSAKSYQVVELIQPSSPLPRLYYAVNCVVANTS